MSFVNRFITAIVIALAIASVAAAQKQDITAQAANVTEFDVNGLKVILKRRASAPTVAVGLFFRGGSRNIAGRNAGIENLMLNSALEASRNYSREVVRREIARSGSSLGASAGNDFSVVSLASTRENFDRMWKIFTDVTINPIFDPADVSRAREQIVTALREQETTPDAALDALEEKIVYAGHPYANDSTGTIETLGAMTPEQLRAYHKQSMVTSRLLLVVVGDLDADDLKARVTASYGTLPRGTYNEAPLPPFDFSKPTLDVVSRSLPTNYVKGDFPAPSLSSDDYYAMRVAISILSNRIFQEVRVKRQLSYAPSAEMNNSAANSADIYVTAVDANQAVKVMLKEIERLKHESATQDELSGVAGEFLTTYYLKEQTNAAQAIDLARYELIGGGWRNSFEFLNRIRDVRPENIRSVANKYMKNIRFVVIGDPAAVDKSVFVAASE